MVGWRCDCRRGTGAAVALPQATPNTVWESAAAARTVTLPDGITATLAPRSRLTAVSGDATQLALVGSAYFDVTHRPDRPLAITIKGYVVRDIGTRFTVTGGGDVTRVAVAQGQVSVSGPALRTPVTLAAGREFVASSRDARIGTVASGDVGSRRGGTLVYADAPLALVAADITRYSGSEVTIDPALDGRRLTGTLTIGDGSGLTAAVGAILDLDVRRDARGVHLQPRG